MTREGVADTAGRVLRPVLRDRAIEAIDVREDEDWAGNPSLYIDIVLVRGSRAVDGDLSIRLQSVLGDELLASGEQRFPYLSIVDKDENVESTDHRKP